MMCTIVETEMAPSVNPLQAGSVKLYFASWIDNVYALAPSASAAIHNLSVFGEILQRSWLLQWKSSSRKWMAPGNERVHVDTHPGWVNASPFPVLGMLIEPGGAPWADCELAESACWKRFFGGAGNKAHRKLPLQVRLRDLDRTCAPAYYFRSSWWSMSAGVITQIDRAQAIMTASLQRLPRDVGESEAEYWRRRHRAAGKICRERGLWSTRCAARTLKWHDHISRNHIGSWPGYLLQTQSPLWLRAQRRVANSASEFAGALGMRSSAGHPHVRWEEGVVFAERHLKALEAQRTQEIADAIPRRNFVWVSPEEFERVSITRQMFG